ncbi:putative cytochrome P450 monooxygenase [Acephala macrosclerotiorum]|nr:putative cytochrome P450 monooxygenase [Acephala macrosclerotiorum]
MSSAVGTSYMQAFTTFGFTNVALLVILGLFLYSTSIAIYNAYFHPLRNFPGPKLWATTFLVRHIANMRGHLDSSIKDFHARYGPVIRFSPDELSFTSEQAWKDIHTSRDQPLQKDPSFYMLIKLGKGAAPSIFNADKYNHPRVRKALSHAFSEKALRDQEPFVKPYVDLLVEKLKGVSSSGMPADMVEWYNFTTFDVIGDLAIGKSFNCLQNSQYHDWVASIWKSIKIGPYIRTVATYTELERLFKLLAPRSLIEARMRHEEYVKVNTRERLSKGIIRDRPDFLSYILKSRGTPDELSDREVEANTNFLLLAGSETTATALSGTTFYLLKTPEAMKKLTDEVRGAFEKEEDINFVNCGERLPYMMACFQEGLRLYPPGPIGAPRRTTPGEMTIIDGYQVPGYTSVGVHAWTASNSPSNFHLPQYFIPERWLLSATIDTSSPFFNDHRAASQPFSLGPRNCLGKSFAYNEMRVILARVLWNFDLVLEKESASWNEQKTFTLWEKGALMCRLKSVRRVA